MLVGVIPLQQQECPHEQQEDSDGVHLYLFITKYFFLCHPRIRLAEGVRNVGDRN